MKPLATQVDSFAAVLPNRATVDYAQGLAVAKCLDCKSVGHHTSLDSFGKTCKLPIRPYHWVSAARLVQDFLLIISRMDSAYLSNILNLKYVHVNLLLCLERSKEASYQWSSWSHWPQNFSNSYCFIQHLQSSYVIVSSHFWGLRLGNGKRESNTDTLCSLCCSIYVHLLVLNIDWGFSLSLNHGFQRPSPKTQMLDHPEKRSFRTRRRNFASGNCKVQ